MLGCVCQALEPTSVIIGDYLLDPTNAIALISDIFGVPNMAFSTGAPQVGCVRQAIMFTVDCDPLAQFLRSMKRRIRYSCKYNLWFWQNVLLYAVFRVLGRRMSGVVEDRANATMAFVTALGWKTLYFISSDAAASIVTQGQ